jgi:hypothetical protein
MIACPAPHAHVAGRNVCWFHICGATGLAASVIVAVAGAERRGLPIGPIWALTVVGVAVFLTLAMVTKVIVGEERLTYYHHELAILGSAAVFLHLTHHPVLAYLDVVAAGVGAFLVCGRIGCLLAGCCHGRPARWGVVYSSVHAEDGFPTSHVGVPLMPVQLIEAGLVTLIVFTALQVQADDATDGAALAVALVGYGSIRFSLEFIRGDVRPKCSGLTEAQWTSAVIAGLVVVAGVGGRLAVPGAVTAIAVVLVVVAAHQIVTNRRPRRDRRAFRSPRHTGQLLLLIREPPPADGRIAVGTTSLGVVVSTSSNGRLHWGLSWPDHCVDQRDGKWVGRLAVRAGVAAGTPEVHQVNGVVHVLGRSTGGAAVETSPDLVLRWWSRPASIR